ncbi:MAG: tetratricopeptide repeat protein [Schlesneria sp.]|nr:tetratricopeptide repeat protein [Schlesneria sp.]
MSASIHPQSRTSLWRWSVRALIALLLISLLAGGTRWMFWRQQRASIAAARSDLSRLPSQSTAAGRMRLARHAAGALNSYDAAHLPSGGMLLRYVAQVLTAADGVVISFPNDLQLSSVDTDDLLLAAESFLGARHLGLAEPILQTAYDRTDQRVRMLKLMASVEYELGNDELVLACCQEWEQLEPTAPVPWLITVFVYENRGKLQMVLEPLRHAIDRSPPPAAVYRTQLVNYLIQLRQVPDARREFSALQKLGELPHDSLTEARLLFAEGESTRALEMAQSLLPSTPNDPPLLALIGKIYLARHAPAEALPILTLLVDRFPYEPEAHYLLGQALSRLKRPDESKLHLDRHQALVRAKTEIYKLQRQAAREPNNPEIRIELAQRCEEVQWTERADHWRQAAEAVRSAQAIGI